MDNTTNHHSVGLVFGHGSVVEAMRRQQVLVAELRALVLPLLWADACPSVAGLTVQLFEDVLACNTCVISKLEASINRGGGGGIELVDDKSKVRKNLDGRIADQKSKEQARPDVGRKRRNGQKQSRSLITHVPHYDGRHWRKYGQKHINGTQHPRSYYRCAYSKEQNCQATKTIQQQAKNNGVAGDDTASYTVVYYGAHACKAYDTVQLPRIVDTDPRNGRTETTNVFSLPEMQEFATDFDEPALVEAFADWDNWEMVTMAGFDQGITSPVYVGGFNC